MAITVWAAAPQGTVGSSLHVRRGVGGLSFRPGVELGIGLPDGFIVATARFAVRIGHQSVTISVHRRDLAFSPVFVDFCQQHAQRVQVGGFGEK